MKVLRKATLKGIRKFAKKCVGFDTSQRLTFCIVVRDRIRTKMERNILADVEHPFIVKVRTKIREKY